MAKNHIFEATHEGVMSIGFTCAPANKISAEQNSGSLYIELNKVVYFRDVNENSGLVHLIGGIDIILDKPTYAEFVKTKLEQKRHWGYD